MTQEHSAAAHPLVSKLDRNFSEDDNSLISRLRLIRFATLFIEQACYFERAKILHEENQQFQSGYLRRN